MSYEDEKDTLENPNEEEKEEGDDLDPDLEDEEEDKDVDELDKPLTKREWLEWQRQQKKNRFFASKRHQSKDYKPDPNKSGKENPLDSRLSALEVQHAKINFATEHGLSAKEVEKIWIITGGKLTAKALEDPFVKGGLERIRASENLKNNMPSGSGSSSFEVEGKKWEEMTPQEKQRNFPARQRAILASKKR